MLTGNREFNESYENYKNLILRTAYTYSGNREAAEERGSRGHYTRDFSEIVYRIRQHEEREYPFMAVYHCEKYGIKL